MLSGHPLPPDMDETPLTAQYFHTWTKPGDVMVATGARSGQVWLLNIVHLLHHDAQDDGYELFFERRSEHSRIQRVSTAQSSSEDTRLTAR
mmetsp:Transcript_69680/g.194786  ORF Transcript_69680/g.194786 Transcript_69680/m.194786 type:complete len:91 (+) Transcript_69680:98-370(+)